MEKSTTYSHGGLQVTLDTSDHNLNQCPLGVLFANPDRQLLYLNPAGCQILGIESWDGLSLDDIVPDYPSRTVLHDQLAQRQVGAIGNYRIVVTRKNDGRRVLVEVTGLPVNELAPGRHGSFAIFRSLELDELAQQIYTDARTFTDPAALLQSVAEKLQAVIPFELITVARYSSDHRHVHTFFTHGHKFTSVAFRRRWHALDKEQAQWLAQQPTSVWQNLRDVLEQVRWRSKQSEPLVQELLAAGFTMAVRKPIVLDNRFVGSVMLYSRHNRSFGEHCVKILDQLPFDVAVARAIEMLDSRRTSKRLNLVRLLNECTSIVDACNALAKGLVDLFNWHHVSVFRVDEALKCFVLVAQHSGPCPEPIRLPDGYTQSLDKGLLGAARHERRIQVVRQISEEPAYFRGEMTGEVNSEMCCPVQEREDSNDNVHFVINVEDSRENAFSSDEVAEIQDLVHDISIVLRRIRLTYLMRHIFYKASDPLVITDSQLQIRRINLAAAQLLGLGCTGAIGSNLASCFKAESDKEKLKQMVAGESSMLSVGLYSLSPPMDATPSIPDIPMPPVPQTADRDRSAYDLVEARIPVLVRKEALPEGLDRSIFVLRDVSEAFRKAQAELFDSAASEMAIEASTPLAAAMYELGGLSSLLPQHTAVINKIVRRLGRVKRSFTRLAAFNPQFQLSEVNFCTVNLAAEVEAILDGMMETDRDAIRLTVHGAGAYVCGDALQISLMLESLMLLMVRGTPHEEQVQVHVKPTQRDVTVAVQGRLPSRQHSNALSRFNADLHTDFALTELLARRVMSRHDGVLAQRNRRNGCYCIELKFPRGGEPR